MGRVEQRRQPRIPFSCSARLTTEGHKTPMAAQVLNLSQAGLFLTTDVVPVLGTPVRCRFRLGRTPRELAGRVAWISRSRAEVGDATSQGAGIEFTDLSQDDQSSLAEVLEQISQSAPNTKSLPVENLSVWFEGLSAPVRTQGQVHSNEIVVTTLLPFLRVGSDVKVGLTSDDGLRYRYARIEGLALDAREGDEPPRIVVTMRATDAVPKEPGELASAMRSRGEAFSESSKPPARRASDTVQRSLTPSPQFLGEAAHSLPRSMTPPPLPRSMTPPPLPRSMTPPPVAFHAAAVSSATRKTGVPSAAVPLAAGVTHSAVAAHNRPRSLPWKWVALAASGIALGVGAVGFISGRLSAPTAVVADVEAPTTAAGPHIAQAPKPRLTAIEIPVDVTEAPTTAVAARADISAEQQSAEQNAAAVEQLAQPQAEATSHPTVDPSLPPSSADILAESNAEPPTAAVVDATKDADDQIPLPPRYLHAPFTFEQDAETTTVVVPVMGLSKPTDILELAPQPGVAVVLSKAKLPRRAASYMVKHPVIDFVSLESRPLGIYVRVLFGPRAQGYKIKNSMGEIRIVVNHRL
jgi:Tfp pilus assembly protein PilZ